MDWNRKNVWHILTVVFAGIAFYVGLQHLGAVVSALSWVVGILWPFLLGGAIAFVCNVPMRAIERHLFPRARRAASLRRPLAYLLTLVCILGVLTLASVVIVPSVKDAVSSVSAQLPDAVKTAKSWLDSVSAQLPGMGQLIAQLDVDWNQLTQKALSVLQNLGDRLVSSGGNLVGGVISGVTSGIIAFIFSIYILMQKEKLMCQLRQCLYALLPRNGAEKTLAVLALSNRTFSNFLSGQCLEAVILGSLFVVAMTVFRMPYALLVGVLISLTALIPIVGAFIGCGVGALLIAISDPWKALMFVVLFLVLQQIEGNLIYPNVVGSSVGLPSIWVLAAVTVGGKLMGVAGMLVFIPLCSVMYALFRGFVRHRLAERQIPEEAWKTPVGRTEIADRSAPKPPKPVRGPKRK